MGRGAASLALLALALVATACRDEPPSVLLLTVDTLRQDHLGVHGDPRDLTPHLDALARESVVFESAYAPVPFTRPSVAALLTGRYPEALGVVSNMHPFERNADTLAGLLRRRGYATAAVVSNAVLHTRSGLDHGFHVYDARFPEREQVRRIPERTAEPTTEAALRQLDRLRDESERFFLWVHYQDPHGPYTPPEGLRARFRGSGASRPDDPVALEVGKSHRGLGEIPLYQYIEERRDPAFYRAGYAAEVHHTDVQIGRLLSALEERGLDDDVLVVFASDHGEALGEGDYWFAHGEYLTRELVKVPLFLRVPGLAPQRRNDVASLVDVLPTILSAVGAPVPEDAAGRNLLAEDAAEESGMVWLDTFDESTVRRRGLVAEGWKLVRTEQARGASERFEPVTPGAGAAQEPPARLAERLRARLERAWRRADAEPRDPAPQPSDEERRALEALGYVD